MNHTASHSIVQEQKSYSTPPRTGVRSRSGSTAVSEYTDRVSSLPKSFNAHAPKSDGLHDLPKHRRSTSLAFNNSPSNRNSMALRRQSADIRPPLPQTILDTPMGLPIDAPPRSRIRTFYDNNRGLAYVLLAQVFGCLMNVTTRLLEIEGNHGEGMHPFQVKHYL